jgi:hypothetical protein
MTLPGALNLLMSENPSCEKFTPTSGPGGLLFTPGGKCCCTMNPAVRELKAFCPLLKNAAVPALAMAWATEGSAELELVLTAQTPSTQPSRSVMATTALVRSGLPVSAVARVTACATTVWTSASVSCACAARAVSKANRKKFRERFTTRRG